jgi:HD-GYP domain-containing protein (c-di-GMP phosphodiesterase class II)
MHQINGREGEAMVEGTEQAHDETKELRRKNRLLRRKVMERTWEVVRLNQAVEQGFNTAVQAMSAFPEISNHARRVAMVVTKLAPRLGLSPSEQHQVEVAASLHDIGKIRLSRALVNKAEDKLKPAEREQLRQHVTEGELILRMVPSLGEAALYVRHHHERYDGKGYPDGLSKKEIPRGARIIAVANAYDKALNPGSRTISPIQALQKVQPGWGTLYDPEVIEALISEATGNVELGQQKKETRIAVHELRPGMVLSRDLMTRQGVLLLARNVPVEHLKVSQILRYHRLQQVMDHLYVYNKGAGKPVSR